MKAKGRYKTVRHTSDFYTKKIVTKEETVEELKVHVLIDDIKKTFKGLITKISFSVTELHKDESYGFSVFSENKERQIRFFVYKQIIQIFCDLQMKMKSGDSVADYIGNTTLLDEIKKDKYESLSTVFRKDGIQIEEFFNKRKFVLIRFLQGDDSNIE